MQPHPSFQSAGTLLLTYVELVVAPFGLVLVVIFTSTHTPHLELQQSLITRAMALDHTAVI